MAPESGGQADAAGALGAASSVPGRSLASFYADRDAPLWDGGQPLGQWDVSRFVSRFSPDDVDPGVWARIEGPVRGWVLAAVPNKPQRARNLLNATTQLAVWADRIGMPLDPEVILRPEFIDRFVVEGCKGLKKGTVTNYRTQLRAVGRAVVDPGLFPPQPVFLPRTAQEAPYTQAEVTGLVAWSRGLPTESMRRNSRALLAMGLGAGLSSQEMARLVGDDVVVDEDGVLIKVTGDGGRVVPVLRRWEDEIVSLAEEVGARPLFLPNRSQIKRHHIPNFVERCMRRSPGTALSVARLRITWMVGQISAGTPLHALAEHAGVLPAQLSKYFVFVPAVDPTEARRMIRDAGSS